MDKGNNPYIFPPNDPARNNGRDNYGSYAYNFMYRFNGDYARGLAPYSDGSAGRLSDVPLPAETVLTVETNNTQQSSLLYTGYVSGGDPGGDLAYLRMDLNRRLLGFPWQQPRLLHHPRSSSGLYQCHLGGRSCQGDTSGAARHAVEPNRLV
jgi:hypothetical protein